MSLSIIKTDSNFSTVEAFLSLVEFEVKKTLLTQVVKSELANLRAGNAHTKTRAEVRGGGKKPWRQKGTGRARHGSRRSPIWVGGGITFGPRNTRNYHQKINKSARLSALKSILKDRLQDNKVFLLENLDYPKTSKAIALLDKISTKSEIKVKNTAIIYSPEDKDLVRGFANSEAKLIPVENLKIVNLVNAQTFILTPKSLATLETKINK